MYGYEITDDIVIGSKRAVGGKIVLSTNIKHKIILQSEEQEHAFIKCHEVN